MLPELAWGSLRFPQVNHTARCRRRCNNRVFCNVALLESPPEVSVQYARSRRYRGLSSATIRRRLTSKSTSKRPPRPLKGEPVGTARTSKSKTRRSNSGQEA